MNASAVTIRIAATCHNFNHDHRYLRIKTSTSHSCKYFPRGSRVFGFKSRLFSHIHLRTSTSSSCFYCLFLFHDNIPQAFHPSFHFTQGVSRNFFQTPVVIVYPIYFKLEIFYVRNILCKSSRNTLS